MVAPKRVALQRQKLSVSMRQRPGAGGCKKKRRRLGTLGQEADFNVEAKEAE